jgi:hypothetical protein
MHRHPHRIRALKPGSILGSVLEAQLPWPEINWRPRKQGSRRLFRRAFGASNNPGIFSIPIPRASLVRGSSWLPSVLRTIGVKGAESVPEPGPARVRK